MKHKWMAFAGIVAAASVSNAAVAEEDGHIYVEGGLHYVNFNTGRGDVDLGLVGLNGGYQFANGLGIEAFVAQGLMDKEVGSGPYSETVNAGTVYGAAGKYTYDINDIVHVYGKIRYTSISGKVVPATLEREAQVGWGAGASYDITDRTYVSAEFNQFLEYNYGGYLGLGFRF